MFMKGFWRFVRKFSNPMPTEKASRGKRILSVMYLLFAWNAFGLVCYMFYTGRGDWRKYYGYKTEEHALESPAQEWAKTLKIEKAKIIRMSGLQKQAEYDFEYKSEEQRETIDD